MARRFGYSRVSTSDQDWSLQLEALTKAGVDDRDIFREKASGAKRDRTEWARAARTGRAATATARGPSAGVRAAPGHEKARSRKVGAQSVALLRRQCSLLWLAGGQSRHVPIGPVNALRPAITARFGGTVPTCQPPLWRSRFLSGGRLSGTPRCRRAWPGSEGSGDQGPC
jgi:hypothetical protein